MQGAGASRLNQMQASFQQRQLVEKEQKLVRMYEAAQARALGKVKAGAETAPGNASSQQAGKVRQMFEERRTKGIDKSYPLQPLPNAGQGNGVSKQGALVTRNGFHKTVTSHSDGETRHTEVTLETRKTSSINNNIEESSSITKSHNFESDKDADYNLNDEEFPYEESIAALQRLDIDPPATSNGNIGKGLATNKLPNVGGSLLSRRPAKSDARVSNTSNGLSNVKERIAPRNSINHGEVKEKTTASPTMRTVRPTASKPRPAAAAASPSLTKPQPAPLKSPAHERPMPKTPSKTSSSPSPNTMNAPRAKMTIVRNVVTLQPASKPVSGASSEGCCRVCQRRFAPDRLAKHEEICAKAASKKRKPYDALKHRVSGTEAETYVRHAKKATGRTGAQKASPAAAAAAPSKPSNWRKKHEEFINAIREAKKVQAHINKGGKLSDLPPPPPSDTSDYVSCPHCGRRFNQSAAERHIPKCKDFQFNKPKPSTKKR